MRWVLVLFVVVPLVELYLLLHLAAVIDFWPTVGLVVLTGVAGGALAKTEGLKVWRAWCRALETMAPPEQGVIDGILVLAGGLLLITPGVLTDIAGLLLLIPWSRRLIARQVRMVVDRSIAGGKVQVLSAGFSPGFSPRGRATVNETEEVAAHYSAEPKSQVVETTGESIDK